MKPWSRRITDCRLERLEKQAAELTQMLTTAVPEDIRAIQDQLDAVELQRQVLEEKRLEVNEAALKRYHQVLDTLAFPAAELPRLSMPISYTT